MDAREADELAERIAALLLQGSADLALSLLAPVLAQRAPFRLLDRIGAAIGGPDTGHVDAFLRLIADGGSEGGWVVIGSALRQQLSHDVPRALLSCQEYACMADVWYGADILGERVPGPALLLDFHRTLSLIAPWREDNNIWVRRMVGVAAHFWAKRSRGSAEMDTRASELLEFLAPMFTEWEMDAAKGIGWGLKTIGRYYPRLLADWLPTQLERRHRALMRRKAITYLPDDLKAYALGIPES